MACLILSMGSPNEVSLGTRARTAWTHAWDAPHPREGPRTRDAREDGGGLKAASARKAAWTDVGSR